MKKDTNFPIKNEYSSSNQQSDCCASVEAQKHASNPPLHSPPSTNKTETIERGEMIEVDDFSPDSCVNSRSSSHSPLHCNMGLHDDIGSKVHDSNEKDTIYDNDNVDDDEDDNPARTATGGARSPASEPSLTFREHSKEILMLTLPIIASEIFQNTLPVVDLAFVGRLSKDELAAAALATVWFNVWNATMLGFCTAIDTLLAQAFGANQMDVFAMWTGNGMIVVMIMTVFMAGLLALCKPIMILFGQDPTLSEEAGQFSYRLIPGLFPYYAFKVLVKHLQTQDILLPGILVGLVANLFNIFFNWFFIFYIDMRLDGAPIATTLTRFMELIVIGIYFVYHKNKHLRSSWPKASTNQLIKETDTTITFMKLAGSGALSFSAEAWSFEVTTILAGLLGTIALDAHIITLSIATFLYLSFPFAISLAVSIRVGQLIGEQRPADAQRSSFASFVLTVIVQATSIAILLPLSGALGHLFSSDEDVAQLVSELIPLSCIFMMGDCLQSTTGGILRGLGRQHLVFVLNLVGFWVLGVPTGAILTFVAKIGVKGLWWGMSIGIYSSAAIGLLILKYRVTWTKETLKAQERISIAQRGSNIQLEDNVVENP